MKSIDVPPEFCKLKCCAWRGNKCMAITAGPGECLWPDVEIKTAIGQGIKRAEKKGNKTTN